MSRTARKAHNLHQPPQELAAALAMPASVRAGATRRKRKVSKVTARLTRGQKALAHASGQKGIA